VDFFLLGHIEALIYTSSVSPEEDLDRIVEAATTTRQQPGIFERSLQGLLCRCLLCITVGGRTFEKLH
jgi:hypothetical protein